MSKMFRGDDAFSEAQIATLAAALPVLARGYTLERYRTVEGDLLLLIIPPTETMATFVVDAAAGGINLSRLIDDVLESCGHFATMAEMILILRDLAAIGPGLVNGTRSSMADGVRAP